MFKAVITNYQDTEFLTEIELGTHKQKFNVSFDTTSSNLWVFSDLTSPDLPHNRFCCKASDTCSFVKRLVDVKYGNKEVTGSAVKDSVFAFRTELKDFEFLAAHDIGGKLILF